MTENIHTLSGKAIEADARITGLRSEIREKKQALGKFFVFFSFDLMYQEFYVLYNFFRKILSLL